MYMYIPIYVIYLFPWKDFSRRGWEIECTCVYPVSRGPARIMQTIAFKKSELQSSNDAPSQIAATK